MTWKKQCTSKSVDIDVTLDDFSEVELLQGLIDAKWLSEDEASQIKARAGREQGAQVFLGSDAEELSEATSCIRRGRKSEALIHIERFLGRDWIGALQ